MGVLNWPLGACARMGAGREERNTSARGNSASSSLKSGGAIAPTAPTVPTPMLKLVMGRSYRGRCRSLVSLANQTGFPRSRMRARKRERERKNGLAKLAGFFEI